MFARSPSPESPAAWSRAQSVPRFGGQRGHKTCDFLGRSAKRARYAPAAAQIAPPLLARTTKGVSGRGESSGQAMPNALRKSERGPMFQGTNSSWPMPWCSLFVCRPLATANDFSKISRPTSATRRAVQDHAGVDVHVVDHPFVHRRVRGHFDRGRRLASKAAAAPRRKDDHVEPARHETGHATGSRPGVSMTTNPWAVTCFGIFVDFVHSRRACFGDRAAAIFRRSWSGRLPCCPAKDCCRACSRTGLCTTPTNGSGRSVSEPICVTCARRVSNCRRRRSRSFRRRYRCRRRRRACRWRHPGPGWP